jgi:kynurenine formamidase
VTHQASRPHYGGLSEFTITRVFMVGSTGTYLDSPWHRHADREDLAGLDLATLVDREGVCLTPELQGREIRLSGESAWPEGAAVLLRTGWSDRWGSPAYWTPGPYLGRDAVAVLLRSRPSLVGVDFWNADDPDDPARPAHTQLLAARIPIVEHLTALDQLPERGFRFFAAPPAMVGGASFPVRAFAVIDQAGGVADPRKVRRYACGDV